MSSALRVPAAPPMGRARIPVSGTAIAAASAMRIPVGAGYPGLFHLSLTDQAETRYLFGRIGVNWIIREPLAVRIERDEAGDYVASDDQLAMYGVGADRQSAIADYVTSLIEYHELIAEESRNHPPTVALLHRIQRFVVRVHA